MGIVQRMSAAALAAMLLTTVIPETQVLAAETTAVETVESQETADTEENATEETAEDQTQGETVIEEAAAADLQDQGTEEVSSRNYALYTETKQAGEEEIASEAQAAEEAAAAQAAQEAAEAAAAQKKAAAAAAASSSNSGSGYTGRKLTRSAGTVQGPSGKEVYYNMNMSTVVSVLKRRGYSGSYWVRNDGVKMFGDYVMVAANYNVHPYGSIVQTTLGAAIVCDTGTFASSYPNCLDVAVSW